MAFSDVQFIQNKNKIRSVDDFLNKDYYFTRTSPELACPACSQVLLTTVVRPVGVIHVVLGPPPETGDHRVQQPTLGGIG